MRCCGAAVIAAAMVVAVAVAVAADEEDDTAAFALSVEGVKAGTRCAGALFALRAALTSARCARAPDLWVRASHAAPAVRVLRVAVADLHVEEVAGAEAEWVWGGVGVDLALLELADTVRGARPILAAAGGECTPRAACYVPRGRARHMRVVPSALEPAVRCVSRGARWPSPLQERALCVLGSRLCRADWGAALVCGGKLCGVLSRSAQSEGSERERGEDEDRRDDALVTRNDTQCGDTHAAVSVPRAHRFMRCAMLRGACGRGECERVCAERWLHEETAPAAAPRPATTVKEQASAPTRLPLHAHGGGDKKHALVSGGAGGERWSADTDAATFTIVTIRTRENTRARAGAAGNTDAGASGGDGAGAGADDATSADVGAAASAESASEHAGEGASEHAGEGASEHAGEGASEHAGEGASEHAGEGASEHAGEDTDVNKGATRIPLGHGSFEFEPNRVDFKMTPARTTALCLKAGEYGDNAAEYGAGAGAEEGGGCGATPTRSTPQPAARARAVLHAEMEARVSPGARAVPGPAAAAARPPPPVSISPLLLPLTTACRLLYSL